MTEKKVKKSKNSQLSQYGKILFIIGVCIAIIGGIFKLDVIIVKIITGTLAMIGIAIGLLNIRQEESVGFLLASITLVMLLSPFLGLITQYFIQSQVLVQIFTYLVALIVPAALVVALKTIFLTAKDD